LKNPPVVKQIAIRYQDLDPYGHVNKAVYLVLPTTTHRTGAG
jgi:acyl-CoA thioesterase FadM